MKTLISQSKWLVNDHVLLVAIISFATGIWSDNQLLIGAGAWFCGVGMSPLFPVWREAKYQRDHKYRHLAQRVQGFSIWYWALIVGVLLLALSSIAKQVF